MSYILNNEQKLNEIIFAHRNKAYGAYVLRSDYGFTIAKSLALVISGAASLAITAYMLTRVPKTEASITGQVITDTSVIVIPFKKEEEDVIPKTKTKTTPPPPSSSGEKKPDLTGKPLVVDTTATDNSKAVVANTVVSSATVSTDLPGDARSAITSSDAIAGDDAKTDKDGIADPFGIESEAEFNGGLKALYKFIKDNLRYPEEAYYAGVEGSVFVKFVVDENGKVTRLTLLNSRGYGLDEEALRVCGMIPNFKSPAKMKGQPVKSYYQVPIKFRISR